MIFPVADGRITLSGRDQELRTSTLIRHRPIRGESHNNFLGESVNTIPPNTEKWLRKFYMKTMATRRAMRTK